MRVRGWPVVISLSIVLIGMVVMPTTITVSCDNPLCTCGPSCSCAPGKCTCGGVNDVAKEVPLDQQQQHGNTVFPLLMVPGKAASLAALTYWVKLHRDDLLAKARANGAILFRGFSVVTAQDFDDFVAAFRLPNFSYDDSLSNAVRVVKTSRVFTANEAPAQSTIFLHHELAQTPSYPSTLFFFAEKAADEGGATPMIRSDILWERLLEEVSRAHLFLNHFLCLYFFLHKEPQFAHQLLEKGLKYTHSMGSNTDLASNMGRTWQSTLKATTREEAERQLTRLGYTWVWLEDGRLQVTSPALPATKTLPDGRTTMFSQFVAAWVGWSKRGTGKPLTFGDGTELDKTAADNAVKLAYELVWNATWQTGDVALVDNFVAQHGRWPFGGTRKVLASLCG